MNCDEIRRHWNLYHDSEGDAELHWQISQHLEHCIPCAEWFAKQSRIEDLLTDKLREPADDGQVWASVLAGAGLTRPKAARRWLLFTALAVCAATLLLAVFGPWRFARIGEHRDQSLSALTANCHERLSSGRLAIPFESSSDTDVENYLRDEVTFPVRCPPRQDSGFAVQGAGTCRLGSQPAAFVVGQVDQTPVSIFILSRDSLPQFPHQQQALRTEAIHRCREGQHEMALSVIDRNLVLVIGDVSQERLLRVLRAYGTYPHG